MWSQSDTTIDSVEQLFCENDPIAQYPNLYDFTPISIGFLLDFYGKHISAVAATGRNASWIDNLKVGQSWWIL